MLDFILLMHNDAAIKSSSDMWDHYFASLRERGAFVGGSSIGHGECVRKAGTVAATTDHLNEFIHIQARDLSEAKQLVNGNPVFECGGTVEIRELPKT